MLVTAALLGPRNLLVDCLRFAFERPLHVFLVAPADFFHDTGVEIGLRSAIALDPGLADFGDFGRRLALQRVLDLVEIGADAVAGVINLLFGSKNAALLIKIDGLLLVLAHHIVDDQVDHPARTELGIVLGFESSHVVHRAVLGLALDEFLGVAALLGPTFAAPRPSAQVVDLGAPVQVDGGVAFDVALGALALRFEHLVDGLVAGPQAFLFNPELGRVDLGQVGLVERLAEIELGIAHLVFHRGDQR